MVRKIKSRDKKRTEKYFNELKELIK